MSTQERTPAGDTLDAKHDGVRKRLLIDGELISLDKTFPSLNPATGEVLGHAPDAGVSETNAAIAAARRAFDKTDWATNVELRLRCLDQLHQALLDNLEDLRQLTMAEVGATRVLTEGNQLEVPIGIVKYYADLLREYPMTEDLGEVEIGGQRHHRWTEKEAAGVVSAIAAYNYPTHWPSPSSHRPSPPVAR